jgi:hypothetical protein
MLISLLALAIPAVAAPCGADVLEAAVTHGEQAFAARDKPAVLAASGEALALVGCQGEATPPLLVARLHGLQALVAFLEGEVTVASRAFAAARWADPNYDFPSSALPEGHPARSSFESALGAHGTLEAIEAPPSLVVHVDGRPSLERPTARPLLLQAGAVAQPLALSTLVASGAPLPELPAPQEGVALPTATPAATPKRTSWPWFAGAAASGLASGGLYLASLGAEDNYYASETKEQAEERRARVNGLTVAASATLGLAVAGVAGGVVTLVW